MRTYTKSIIFVVIFSLLPFCHSFSPKGSAATPLDKKKIAVLGSGGYLGGVVTGFLQRASSLYHTGLASQFRCIGATALTSAGLNSILSKYFILAQADESYIRLTNLASVESIQQRLEGYDGIILGCDMAAEIRPVTGGTYEKGPNDKTWEVYWDCRKGKEEGIDLETEPVIAQVVINTLEACRLVNIKHVLMVGKKSETERNEIIQQRLDESGIPYTFLYYSGELEDCPNYTYRMGIQGNLVITAGDGKNVEVDDTSFMFREDLAALCLQCIQSLDWSESRCLHVSCDGTQAVPSKPSGKRPDQEWCVNSHILAEKLAGIR